MGTRALTVLTGDKGEEICVLYRQFDGYPSGHGSELAAFLAGLRLASGTGQDDNAGNAFNGMNDCAARIVSHFKRNEIGGFYLYPAGTRGENYIYTVYAKDGAVAMKAVSGKQVLFDGDPAMFDEQVKNEDEEE